MPPMKKQEVVFVNAGRSAFLGVVADRVVGVLYWTEDDQDAWGTGKPDETFIWCWCSVDRPYNHENLACPPLRVGMTQEQIEANRDVAMEAAHEFLAAGRQPRDR